MASPTIAQPSRLFRDDPTETEALHRETREMLDETRRMLRETKEIAEALLDVAQEGRDLSVAGLRLFQRIGALSEQVRQVPIPPDQRKRPARLASDRA